MTQIELNFELSIERALNKALAENHGALETIERLKTLLLIKGKEYRRNNDPYHNFNEGAKLMNVSPMTVLNFFRLKHVISITDLQKDFEQGKEVSEAQINEKYDDILVYTLIELAYTENENEASFEAFRSFTEYLNAKLKFLKKIHGRERKGS